MKSVFCRISMITGILLLSGAVSFASPKDIQYHWSAEPINTLMEHGIVRGYESGRFKPDRHMTKEEFSVLLVSYGKSLGTISGEAYETILGMNTSSPLDSVSAWSRDSVNFLLSTGITTLDENSRFNPQAYITRGEMAQMIYNYKLIEEKDSNSWVSTITDMKTDVVQDSFSDIADSTAKEAIEVLYANGIVNGFADGTFQPDGELTRAEICKVLYNMSGYEGIPSTTDIPKYSCIEVPYLSQVYPLKAYVGCEGTALLMGLKSKGYAKDIELKNFLDNLPTHTSNPAKGFVGSPYKPDKTKKTRTTIFPGKLAEYGNNYGKVSDFSGSSVTELQAELLSGNPVIVYATMDWEEPFYRNYDVEGQTQTFLSNNHVVLAAGYNLQTNEYYICDPYNIKTPTEEFKYWIDGNTFNDIYNVRRHAVVIE